MTQPSLDLQARDSFVTEPAEIRRLTGQNAAILKRLQQGPATRRELQDIACNVTARVSDLRKAGYVIPPPTEDRSSGLAVYRMEREA